MTGRRRFAGLALVLVACSSDEPAAPLPPHSDPPITVRWRSAAPLPQGREAHAVAVFRDALHVAGGRHWLAPDGALDVRDDVFRLRADGTGWDSLPPLPRPVTHMALAALPDRLLALGGTGPGRFVALPDVYSYEPGADEWVPYPPMPESRFGHTAVVVGNQLVVVGGTDIGGPKVVSTLVLDPVTATWEVRARPPNARFMGTAVVRDGVIYFLGGVGGPPSVAPSAVLSVNVYDPLEDRWSRPGLSPIGSPLHAGAQSGDLIHLFGGPKGDHVAYDPQGGEWFQIKRPGGVDREEPAAVTFGTRVFLIGGWTTSSGGAFPSLRRVDFFDVGDVVRR